MMCDNDRAVFFTSYGQICSGEIVGMVSLFDNAGLHAGLHRKLCYIVETKTGESYVELGNVCLTELNCAFLFYRSDVPIYQLHNVVREHPKTINLDSLYAQHDIALGNFES